MPEALTRKTLGWVPVDSGTLCVVDPCYLVDGEGHHRLHKEGWQECCKDLGRWNVAEFTFAHKQGTGVMMPVGGDGRYKVVGEYDGDGRLRRLIVEIE